MTSGRWPLTVEERLWSKVDKSDKGECWGWLGQHSTGGYARFFVDGKTVQASRVVYEFTVGPITDGLELDHLCRNTRCVNPAHLEPVTHHVNVLRSARAQDSCINGHEFTPENTTLRYRKASVQRRCKACERQYMQAHAKRVATRLEEAS